MIAGNWSKRCHSTTTELIAEISGVGILTDSGDSAPPPPLFGRFHGIWTSRFHRPVHILNIRLTSTSYRRNNFVSHFFILRRFLVRQFWSVGRKVSCNYFDWYLECINGCKNTTAKTFSLIGRAHRSKLRLPGDCGTVLVKIMTSSLDSRSKRFRKEHNIYFAKPKSWVHGYNRLS